MTKKHGIKSGHGSNYSKSICVMCISHQNKLYAFSSLKGRQLNKNLCRGSYKSFNQIVTSFIIIIHICFYVKDEFLYRGIIGIIVE